MLAQRNQNAQIDAIEIDEASANEAQYNFEQSDWGNRLNLIKKPFQEFATKC